MLRCANFPCKYLKIKQRGPAQSTEKETVSADNEDAIADVMEQHDQFISSMQSRLAKLQVMIFEIKIKLL